MGEIIKTNFLPNGKTGPLSPFESKVIKHNFKGESKFSSNGVVEYTIGVPPRDDVGVLSKVKIHVNAMEKTILQAFPEKTKRAELEPSTKEIINDMGHLALVRTLEDSDPADWLEDPDGWLALLDEVRTRDLDEGDFDEKE